MKVKLAVTALLLASLLVGCTQMSAEEIAKKMEEKYDKIVDFKGVQRIVMEMDGVKHTQEYEFVFKKPNKMKMYNREMGMLMVSNGKTMWSYNEKKNEVFVMELKQPKVNPDYGEFVKDLLKHFNVELLGSEKVLDRDCYVLRLTPKENKSELALEYVMWVDKEYWCPLKTEINGTHMKMITEYVKIEFNTGVSDEEFNFTPPKGAKVITEEKLKEKLGIKEFSSVKEAQKAANFDILEPSYTAGYELTSIVVMNNSVMLNYAKGQDLMLISEVVPKYEIREVPNAEKVKIGDAEGEYVEFYGSGMLKFKKGDIVVTISGKLDKEEMVRVAESME